MRTTNLAKSNPKFGKAFVDWESGETTMVDLVNAIHEYIPGVGKDAFGFLITVELTYEKLYTFSRRLTTSMSLWRTSPAAR